MSFLELLSIYNSF